MARGSDRSERHHLRTCPQRCGGGLTQAQAPDGRPQFSCAKCGASFTHGHDGGPYAAAVPMSAP